MSHVFCTLRSTIYRQFIFGYISMAPAQGIGVVDLRSQYLSMNLLPFGFPLGNRTVFYFEFFSNENKILTYYLSHKIS
jgi:hypothetical protein